MDCPQCNAADQGWSPNSCAVKVCWKKLDGLRLQNKAYREVLEWIASQSNLFFAECSQAEEIVARCAEALKR